ncbi:MAG: DUF5103 domain-containing protein [Saprospiraceae bacterium]|nr:DUF5103 domain-containing protein [Saprospiraceae bacterium]
MDLYKSFLITVLLSFMGMNISLSAQPDYSAILPVDSVYHPLVRTVHFREGLDPVAMPILYLDRPYTLDLHFDLLEGSPRNLFYGYCYYNRDWTASNLQLMEYLGGFNEMEIRTFRASSQTYLPYVHYQAPLPGRDYSFKVTGNYLLVVYDNAGEIYLTKRIYLTDNSFKVVPRFQIPIDPEKSRTHQSMTFTVTGTNRTTIVNPAKEIRVEVWQNGSLSNKMILGDPFFFNGNQLSYTKQDGILYPAMKEFRRKDVRSIQHRTMGVSYWDQKGNDFHCYFKTDSSRADQLYRFEFDFNGRYYVGFEDQINEQGDFLSEYVWCHPVLKTNIESDYPVYLYGAITDWKLKEEFRLEYNHQEKVYKGKFYIKNAVFDYLYATLNDDASINTSLYEGDWYETENDYFVMIYFRPFGGRYDQMVFAGRFNSNR